MEEKERIEEKIEIEEPVERDATLEDNSPSTLDEDEVQERILEDSNLNGFQKMIARMDDKKWKLAQTVAGAALGIGTAVALFWEALTGVKETAEKKGLSVSLIVALVLALIVPNIIEKQGGRKTPRLRVAMCIALVIAIAIYTVYMFATGGFKA